MNIDDEGRIVLDCGTKYYKFVCQNKKCTWTYNTINKENFECPCCGSQMLRIANPEVLTDDND
jgi:transcription initiation factor IIE alpha subunit